MKPRPATKPKPASAVAKKQLPTASVANGKSILKPPTSFRSNQDVNNNLLDGDDAEKDDPLIPPSTVANKKKGRASSSVPKHNKIEPGTYYPVRDLELYQSELRVSNDAASNRQSLYEPSEMARTVSNGRP